MRGTQDGFLRFGLEFAKGSVIPGSGKGRNPGEVVVLDLDYLFDREMEVVFDCERVAALPESGDRRRGGEGIPGILVPMALVAVLLVACAPAELRARPQHIDCPLLSLFSLRIERKWSEGRVSQVQFSPGSGRLESAGVGG